MRRLIAILLVLVVAFVVPVQAESKIGNWPDGRIWGDLQFYHSLESIRAEGYVVTEQGILAQEGTYEYDGHSYKTYIVISNYKEDAPSASISISGKESTPADALAQYQSIANEMFEKWGTPTFEYYEKPWESDLNANPDVLSKSGEPFTYGAKWREGRYSASISILSEKNGVCSVSLYFID